MAALRPGIKQLEHGRKYTICSMQACNGAAHACVPTRWSTACSPVQGWRPLHSATSAGHEPIARLLISLGADVNAATAQQRTALHYAASKGQRELVELLLQHGAQVGLETEGGRRVWGPAAAHP